MHKNYKKDEYIMKNIIKQCITPIKLTNNIKLIIQIEL